MILERLILYTNHILLECYVDSTGLMAMVWVETNMNDNLLSHLSIEKLWFEPLLFVTNATAGRPRIIFGSATLGIILTRVHMSISYFEI